MIKFIVTCLILYQFIEIVSTFLMVAIYFLFARVIKRYNEKWINNFEEISKRQLFWFSLLSEVVTLITMNFIIQIYINHSDMSFKKTIILILPIISISLFLLKYFGSKKYLMKKDESLKIDENAIYSDNKK